ncbi:MAG: DUF3857 domain-containing protein [Candidatus Omnitrophica bacterium]|nr:DUF3857 domain-containing protein [Candidatus Omnitrophota bacterium]
MNSVKKEKQKRAPYYLILMACCLWSLFGCGSPADKALSLYKKTASLYEKKLKSRPKESTKLEAAKFYYKFNDYKKAKEILELCQDKKARILLAKTYVNLKEYTQAIEVFEKLGPVKDNEYIYLYAKTAEEKNLFPKAVKLYAKLKGPFKEIAQERIEEIGLKIEDKVPKEIKKLLKQQKKFLSTIKEEEAVTLFVDESTKIKSDNSTLSVVHVIQKVLKEKGKEIGEVQIGYDSTYERVELEYARTITPEGKVVYAGKENIRDVSKYLNFPLYSNAKAFIISMPSVDVGAIVEYKAKIYSSKMVNEDDFTYIYRLRDAYPIARQKFKLFVPKKKKASFKYLNQQYSKGFSLTPKIKKTKAEIIYTWDIKEVDPIIPEDKMPPISKINPAIIISSFESWGEIFTWWTALYEDKLALNDEIKTFVKELTKDCKNDLEKARKIHEFCAKNIRYVGVEYGESGHEPHKAVDIFLNRYGDCKDQAILLVAMAQEANLSAYPVLIPTRGVYQISEDFPSINFNHAIAAIRCEGKLTFLDPTSTTSSYYDLPFSDQQRLTLVFLEDDYQLIETPLTIANETIYKMTLDIDKNETATVKRQVIAKGSFASFQRYFLKYTHPQIIKDTLQDKMKAISPLTKFLDHQIIDPFDFMKDPTIVYTFQARRFLKPAKDLRVIPFLSDVGIDVSYVGKDSRRYPVEFVGLFKKTSSVEINLPNNLKIKYFPKDYVLTTQWFDFKTQYTQNEKTFSTKQEFSLKNRFVAKEDYPEFKKNLEEVFYRLGEKVILQKTQ